MTVEQIVETAIAIADSDGLTGVSMIAVAKRLGCTKMALYRYVQAKDDLLTLMLDTAIGGPPESIARASGWRQAVLTWARELLVRYRAHPWSIDVPIGGPALTRNQMLWLESVLQGLRPSPLQVAQKLSLVLLINGHVAFTARLWRDRATTTEQQGPGIEQLAELIQPGDLPEVMHVLAAGHLADEDGDGAEFDFGLSCILDGVAALIAHPRRD